MIGLLQRAFTRSLRLRLVWVLLLAVPATAQERTLRIVAFGDSTTAPRAAVRGVYADRLPALLAAEGIEASVTNAGVGGSHTGRLADHGRHRVRHALDRLEDVRGERPDVVVVQFGANDSWVDEGRRYAPSRIPLADYARNLEQIVTALQRDGATTVLVTPGRLGAPHEDWRNERLESYVEVVRAVAAETRSPLVDVYARMEAFAAETDRSVDDLLLDGLHPNDEGHALIARELARVLAELDRDGALQRRAVVPLITAGYLVHEPLHVSGAQTEGDRLRVGGRSSKLLFGRAPGAEDFRLRLVLSSREPEGRSVAIRIGDSLFGLHDDSGRMFLAGPLFAGAELSVASLTELVGPDADPDADTVVLVDRAQGWLRVDVGSRTVVAVEVADDVRIDLLGLHTPFAEVAVREAVLEGPAIGTALLPRSTLPWIDLAGREDLRVVVHRDPRTYLGHPSSVLLADGRTMLMMFLEGHARAGLRFIQSDDAGRTWRRRSVPEGWNDVPAGWNTPFQEIPILYRMVDPQGVERIRMFTGTWPIRSAHSADGGKSWSALEPIGDGTWGGIVVFADMIRRADGSYLATLHDDGRFLRGAEPRPRGVPRVYTMESRDGGATWGDPVVAVEHRIAYLCEAGLVRSPDGARVAMLMRENSRALTSYVAFSEDEGRTWSAPRALPAALTGDRHQATYAPDGRLLVTFRDTAPGSETNGDWVGWVGTFADIEAGREGQYRVRLGDNHRGADCAYPTHEVLPDGTIFVATYGHWVEGQPPFIIGYHLRLEQLDRLLEEAEK